MIVLIFFGNYLDWPHMVILIFFLSGNVFFRCFLYAENENAGRECKKKSWFYSKTTSAWVRLGWVSVV